VVNNIFVEFGNLLLHLTESKERSSSGPRWTSSGVTSRAEKEFSRSNKSLAWENVLSEPLDSRLTNSVHETKVC